tara:strand:+ start:88 stop:342 length:255 start_codon:yes stop_codon:yes gene_type:complete
MHESEPKNIIFLEEIIQQKLRKEQELVFYEKKLQKLQVKLNLLRGEIKLTNLIIHLVSSEKELDVAKVPQELNAVEYFDKKIKE